MQSPIPLEEEKHMFDKDSEQIILFEEPNFDPIQEDDAF